MQVSSAQAFEWLYQHAMIVGWPSMIFLVWKASKWFNTALDKASQATDQINTLATQIFPAMKESFTNQDKFLESIDQSMKTMVDRLPNIPVVYAEKSPKSKAARNKA